MGVSALALLIVLLIARAWQVDPGVALNSTAYYMGGLEQTIAVANAPHQWGTVMVLPGGEPLEQGLDDIRYTLPPADAVGDRRAVDRSRSRTTAPDPVRRVCVSVRVGGELEVPVHGRGRRRPDPAPDPRPATGDADLRPGVESDDHVALPAALARHAGLVVRDADLGGSTNVAPSDRRGRPCRRRRSDPTLARTGRIAHGRDAARIRAARSCDDERRSGLRSPLASCWSRWSFRPR